MRKDRVWVKKRKDFKIKVILEKNLMEESKYKTVKEQPAGNILSFSHMCTAFTV